MNDTKDEWELGLSGESSGVPVPKHGLTTNFEQSDALVGEILDGRFLIEKDLTDTGADAGGIGLVYLANDMKLMGKKVVVKILQKASLKHEDLARKFLHEKEALIRLDHPGIVRILDSGTLSDGNPFMVMEFIEGYSLRGKLRKEGKLDFATTANIVESVTEALSIAHSRMVLHRDIKPENIMLTPQDGGPERVRLIDFGIARVEESKLAPATEIQRGIGTILYISPEQLAGKLEQTPAVDTYSFAIVVYEMLAGQKPFNPVSMIEMYQLQKEGVQDPPSVFRLDLPKEVDRLLVTALAFEPSERPQNIREFGRDLAKALRGNESFTGNEEMTELDIAKTIPSDIVIDHARSLNKTEVSVLTEELPKPVFALETAASKKSNRWVMWTILGVLILAAASLPVGFAFWKTIVGDSSQLELPKQPEADEKINNLPKEPAQNRELTYFLNVQKMRNGKPFESPFKSSGQEIFENGYKFQMVFRADADGFFYLFNEDKDDKGNLIYNILSPTPNIRSGSAEISAGTEIETSNNTFSGKSGTEVVWLIWTMNQDDDLEKAKNAAFEGQGRVSKGDAVRKLRDFIEKRKDQKNDLAKDSGNKETVVNGNGETIVQKIELEHR